MRRKTRWEMETGRPARKVNAAGVGGGVGAAIGVVAGRILDANGVPVDAEAEWALVVIASTLLAWIAGYVARPSRHDQIEPV